MATALGVKETSLEQPAPWRVEGRVPRNRGTVLTVIGALTIDGLTAMMTIEEATTGDVFLAYVEEVLGPELRPGDIVVVDNLGAHRDHRVKEAVERRGARLFFQPPYSPDKNPIELAWAWVKWSLRTAEARTREALETALRWAMDMLDSTIARLWFRHCGFRNQLL